MPHYAAVASSCFDGLHALHGLLDGEVLLIASQLLDAGIEDGEVEDEFQQALGTAEVEEVFILRGRGAHLVAAFVYELQQLFLVVHLCLFVDEHLVPLAPELRCRACGAITAEAVADSKQQGTIDIEAANAVVLLVAEVLRDGLFFCAFDVGALALDDD